jgi:hypothetical protein
VAGGATGGLGAGATTDATEVGLAAVAIAAGVALGDVLFAVTAGWDAGAAEIADAGFALAVMVLLAGAGFDDAGIAFTSG